ncbi:MAG: hypothetical protein IJT63_04480 [Lachnospiraceae bacterium]|nr:hypothetical protein [Lachnospiraceae bacterium]
MPRYSIRENRIKRGSRAGLSYDPESGVLCLTHDDMYHSLFLRGIDSMDREAPWGRLFFDLETEGDVICCAYAVALDNNIVEYQGKEVILDDFLTDDSITVADRFYMLKDLGARRYVGENDILLYEYSGRYLYVAIDIKGDGEARISNMVVDSTGDNFMNTFPEVYRERNSFFHRYVSIFSSIYNDFGRDIESLPEILDLNTCPIEMLIEYGSWMGIDLKGGFLPEDVIRNIVKESYELNKMKGTKKGLLRLMTLILGEEPVIIEHNLVRAWLNEENNEYPPDFKPKGIYDVTILVNKRITEELRHQIIYMVDQFKPVRTRINIAQMDENVIIDSNTYLDVNSKLPEKKNAILDGSLSLDGTVVL